MTAPWYEPTAGRRFPALRNAKDGDATAAKRAIAVAAADLIEDGQTIAISSGSTTLELARRLVDRRLTVITNALDVATVLVDREGIELIILGGVVRPRMRSMLGHLAELALGELRADTLFMGVGAIDPERGLMNDSVPEILTDRALRGSSRSCVVLADSSKFWQVAPGVRVWARRGQHRNHGLRRRSGRRRFAQGPQHPGHRRQLTK